MAIFTGTETTFGGSFLSRFGIASATTNVNGTVTPISIGVLLQNIEVQATHEVSRVYELGDYGSLRNTFLVGGRASGRLTANHILIPANETVIVFYQQFGDICRADMNRVSLILSNDVCGPLQRTQLIPAMAVAQNCYLVQVTLAADTSNANLVRLGGVIEFFDLDLATGNQVLFNVMLEEFQRQFEQAL